MIRYACRYPDGAAGIALLLVRLCCACAALGVAAMLTAVGDPRIAYPAATLLGALLSLGLLTRTSALLLLATVVAAALTIAGAVQQLLLAGVVGCCAALAIVGAGAFSIDARRHGRRVIQLGARPHDRGGKD
jgi:putative oxidoreductase